MEDSDNLTLKIMCWMILTGIIAIAGISVVDVAGWFHGLLVVGMGVGALATLIVIGSNT